LSRESALNVSGCSFSIAVDLNGYCTSFPLALGRIPHKPIDDPAAYRA
jgi:hypothetical protein